MTILDLEPGLAHLPPGVGERLQRLRPALHERVLAVVRRTLAGQGRSLTGAQGLGLELGVRTAVDAFTEAIADPARPLDQPWQVFRALGRTEFGEGHPPEALRSVLTTGAREIWAFLTGHDVAAPTDLYLIAGALFGFVDTLAGAAAEGYLHEQRESARDWALVRRRLITLLVQPDPPGLAALESAAEAARWPLPGAVLVASVEGTDADHLARACGPGAIAAVIEDAVRLVLPGQAGGDSLRRALTGRHAAIGPVVPVRRARFSYRLSQRALATLPGVVECDAHLLTLLRDWEPGLADHLAAVVLQPLAGVRPGVRDGLAATLLEWLRHQGQVIATAEALHTHPQTVRYRLRRLRELFGDTLDDPDGRLALWLALRR